MRLSIPILVFILTAPFALRAQLDPVTLALRAYQAKDYEKAKELIDIATGDEKFNGRSKTWVFRGYIYKDIYKLDRVSPEGRSYRKESIVAFQKTLELAMQAREGARIKKLGRKFGLDEALAWKIVKTDRKIEA